MDTHHKNKGGLAQMLPRACKGNQPPHTFILSFSPEDDETNAFLPCNPSSLWPFATTAVSGLLAWFQTVTHKEQKPSVGHSLVSRVC